MTAVRLGVHNRRSPLKVKDGRSPGNGSERRQAGGLGTAAACAGSVALPTGLYVHVPWCVKKCPYCDFNSHPVREPVDRRAFVSALLSDLEFEVARAAVAGVDSVFIGGGTPSLFEGAAIAALLEGIAARVPLADECEITLEANPGAADAARFRAYRAAGVNRLSIGVQSLDSDKLRALGRIHSPDDAVGAIEAARAAGFQNINLDLMYGLPGQTVAEALHDLDRALACAPQHLSWYQLTLEPNTPFHHRPPVLPDPDTIADIEGAGLVRLAHAGLERYEVSAFARPGFRCRHNLNYWRFGDYVGIGPGAHGKRTLPDGRIVRRTKLRGPDAYLAAADRGVLSREWALDGEDRLIEYFLNALRLVDGVPVDDYPERTGLSLDTVNQATKRAVALGLLAVDDHRIRPTARGLRYLNDLMALITPS